MKTYDVFISKNSKDAAAAREIAGFLRNAGFTCFESDSSLPQLGKSEYVDQIYEAIDASCNMVVVCSPNEKGTGKEPYSGWVKEEYSAFINEKNSGRKDGNLVVVLVDGVAPSELDIRLKSKECIPYSEYKDKLLQYVSKVEPDGREEEARRFEALKEKAERGDVAAQADLASCYEHGKGTPADLDLAFEWYRKAADSGDALAMFRCWEFMRFKGPANRTSDYYRYNLRDVAVIDTLERDLATGRDPEKLYCLARVYAVRNSSQSEEKAFKYALESAKAGHVAAQTLVASCYERGIGTEKDSAKALEWYEKAAGQGDRFAMYRAFLLYDAKGEHAYAAQLLQKSADAAYLPAVSRVADMYFDGTAVEKNEEKAARLYLCGAEHGSGHCQERIAYCYKCGLGVKKDDALSRYWYKKAAESGSADAQYAMGELSRDDFEACFWYRKAADGGNTDALARLGDLAEDPDRALYCKCVAAMLGNEKALSEIHEATEMAPALGEMWVLPGIKDDDPESLLAEYYQKTRSPRWKELVRRASKGDAVAAYAVARAQYIQEPDTFFQDSFEWLSEAAMRQGHVLALNLLGVFYATEHVPAERTQSFHHENAKTAMSCWKEAAAAGLAEAELNYGLALYYGFSGVVDKEQGKAWICKAMENGCVEAYRHYIRIEKGVDLDKRMGLIQECEKAAIDMNMHGFDEDMDTLDCWENMDVDEL